MTLLKKYLQWRVKQTNALPGFYAFLGAGWLLALTVGLIENRGAFQVWMLLPALCALDNFCFGIYLWRR